MTLWSKEWIAFALETKGWKSEIAGADFDGFVSAVAKAMETPRHGVIVSGEYGCGKTSAMKALLSIPYWTAPTTFDLNRPGSVATLNYANYPASLDYIFNTSNAVLLDDLGAENVVNEYGVRRDYVGEFISRVHTNPNIRLFITTNLHGDELAERYSGRIVSRLKDLCVPYKFVGIDKREWEI